MDIKTTATVDFGDLGGRLLDAERRVLGRYGRIFRLGFQDAWTGWVYKGRPKKDPRNVSMVAWKASIESRRGKATLLIDNRARGYASDEAYVAYVHRAGSTAIEWKLVWNGLQAEHLADMTRDLVREIAKAVGAKRPKVRIRAPRQDTPVLASPLVL